MWEQRTYVDEVEVVLVQAVHVADLSQPVLQQAQVLALHGGAHGTAVIVACAACE
jgi:hypothetical protein